MAFLLFFSVADVKAADTCDCKMGVNSNLLNDPACKFDIKDQTTAMSFDNTKLWTLKDLVGSVIDKTYPIKQVYSCALFTSWVTTNVGKFSDTVINPPLNPNNVCNFTKDEKNIQFAGNGATYEWSIYCSASVAPAPEPTPPAPAPDPAPAPVPETTLCECYKNQASIDAKKPEGSNTNNPKKVAGCTEMSAQKSGDNYSYLVCHYFVNGKFQSSWSQGNKVDANKVADSAADSTSASTNPGSGLSSNEATKAWIKEHYQPPAGYADRGGVIPDCAFSGTCENVNDLLQLGINIGKYVFSIIGSVAFLAFVYGGFTIVFSFGSAEKVKKGTEVLIAAVTGMAIAFGAYMLINFILDALNVTTEFRGIKG